MHWTTVVAVGDLAILAWLGIIVLTYKPPPGYERGPENAPVRGDVRGVRDLVEPTEHRDPIN